MNQRLGGFLAWAALAVVACGCNSTETGPSNDEPAVPGAFAARSVVDAGRRYPYQVFLPRDYETREHVPVIVFLHGSEERGTDNAKQLTVGLGPVVTAAADTWQAITIFPQMPDDELKAHTGAVMKALDAALSEFSRADPNRVYLTGVSLGGIQSYEVAYRNPSRFAAVVPIAANMCVVCITGDPESGREEAYALVIAALQHMPVWQFHGSGDNAVPVEYAREIAAAFHEVNPAAKYTEYPDASHVSTWEMAYVSTDLYEWLFAQHR